MNKPDRSVAPPLVVPEKVSLGKPDLFRLDNGIPVHVINIGEQDVISVELIFKAGKTWETKAGLAAMTNRMLREGTGSYTAKQIAERVDYFGANIKTKAASDNVSVTIYCLRKFLGEVLPILKEVVSSPAFSEQDWDRMRSTMIQRIIIHSEKVETKANDLFYEQIFGAEHAYGYTLKPSHLLNISAQDLKDFFQKRYHPGTATLFVSGKVRQADLALVNQFFGQEDWPAGSAAGERVLSPFDYQPKELRIPMKSSVQSSIRVGLPLFNKHHKDYNGLYLLNMILGGYFNSRLNSNIREDKGYTYGIHSMLVSLQTSGYFLVATEVAKEHAEDTLNEIFYEFERLKNELVSKEELDLVRNFTLGNVLNQINGAFNKTAILKGLYLYGLDVAHFDHFITQIKSTDAKELQRLARIYLNDDLMVKVIAGT